MSECQRCHQERKITRHHILPRCRGGSSDPSNIALVCRPCHDILDAALGLRNSLTPHPRLYNACVKCGDVTAKLKQGYCRACVMLAPEREQREQRREWLRREMAGIGIVGGPDSMGARMNIGVSVSG